MAFIETSKNPLVTLLKPLANALIKPLGNPGFKSPASRGFKVFKTL